MQALVQPQKIKAPTKDKILLDVLRFMQEFDKEAYDNDMEKMHKEVENDELLPVEDDKGEKQKRVNKTPAKYRAPCHQ